MTGLDCNVLAHFALSDHPLVFSVFGVLEIITP
jgi:hypothetical protein